MDLGHTQAEWTRLLGREIGQALVAPLRLLREVRDRFRLSRTQVVNWGDCASAAPQITAATLTGVNLGTNTSALGELFVRTAVNGGGGYDVSLYKAIGASGGDLVAKATGVATNGTGTLVAQNSSGLSGTVTLAGTVTTETNDKHKLVVLVDYRAQLSTIFDGSVEDDEASRAAMKKFYDAVVAQIDNAISAGVRAMQDIGLSAADNPVARVNKFCLTTESTLESDQAIVEGSGAVRRSRTGLFEVLRNDMNDETTGGEQTVQQIAPAGSAGAFGSANTGQGSVASHTPSGQMIPPSTWRFQCIDQTIGAEKFRCTIGFTRAGDDRAIVDPSPLTVKQPWSGTLGFGPITLLRMRTKTGDGSNLNLAATSYFTESGENSANTNDGTLYWLIASNGANWDISFYNSSSYLSTALVAKATNVATGATFQAVQQNSSGLTINGKVGSGPTTTTTGTLVLNTFRTQNSNGQPDEFTVTVTHTGTDGVYQRLLADIFGAALNSASSSPSISDDYVKGNTFVPFLALLN